ncbi:hypothetical protein [uncultured Chitinophaga sp.]|uniref:hypothetical protein n=1 Tax=uncultured Chitinophaga sp. TaxID=339340 RepID=UPI0025E8778F|nr:hypothetical protein [uncultured Chitinophaga sp.]
MKKVLILLLSIVGMACQKPLPREKQNEEKNRKVLMKNGIRFERAYNYEAGDTVHGKLVSVSEYDEKGRLTRRMNMSDNGRGPVNAVEDFSYNKDGKVEEVLYKTMLFISKIKYVYDAAGNNTERNVYTDSVLERRILMSYDKRGNIATMESLKEDKIDYRMEYTYNDFDEEASSKRIDASGSERSSSKLLTRTDTSMRWEVRSEDGATQVENLLDKNGNLILIRNYKNGVITGQTKYRYDADNLLIEIHQLSANNEEQLTRFKRSKD